MASAWELMAGGGTPQNSCEGITDWLLLTLFLLLCVSHVLARARVTHTSCHAEHHTGKKTLFSFFPDPFLLFMPQEEGLQIKPSSDSSSCTLKMHLSGTTSVAENSKGTLESKSIKRHPRRAARTCCQHSKAGRMQQGLNSGQACNRGWGRCRSFSWVLLFLEHLGPSCCWAA